MSKKIVGSGGRNRKSLAGKGPTPKAEDRPYHKAAKAAAKSDRGFGDRRGASVNRSPRSAAALDGQRRAKARKDVIVGINPVYEALQAGVPASKLMLEKSVECLGRVAQIIEMARRVPLMRVTRVELDNLSDLPHQGIALTVPAYECGAAEDLLPKLKSSSLLVACDGITDPRNLGAIIRSAAGFGADTVIIPERRTAHVTPAVWKASAGALAKLPLTETKNLNRYIDAFKKAGGFVIGLDGDADTLLANSAAGVEPVLLVIGSEGKGISRLTREKCDELLAIPSRGIESLNAAVAAAIAMYQIQQLRGH